MTGLITAVWIAGGARSEEEPLFTAPIDVTPRQIAEDPDVRWDYPVVYVRAQRAGDREHRRFYTDFATPVTLEPGADLMLLLPDGSEEILVEGGRGSITDPFVSFDGEWVYFTRIYNLVDYDRWNPPAEGADIYKIHVPTRRVVRLTNQQFTPNLGAADWSQDFRTAEEGKIHLGYGVYNMGPCPLPGGRIVFTSNRDAHRPQKGYPPVALQLFVMDDSDEDVDPAEPWPNNIEKIGHLNLSGALHPVVLTDGRIVFSSLENQGIRGDILWGIWSIRPDGSQWRPVISAFDPGGAPNGFHFQSQLSDGALVIEGYYNQNNSGFGMFVKVPLRAEDEYPAFGPAQMTDPHNVPWRVGRFSNGKGMWYRMPFMPLGAVAMTPFAPIEDMPAGPSILEDENSPRVGKVTHPAGAPDNHLLCVYSPGPANHQYEHLPQIDGGIYLLKGGAIAEEPGDLLLIKNDPEWNEGWPRALVPYQAIYGIEEPRLLPDYPNDGSAHPALPAGSPFGLVGTSSLYKRESFPNGAVFPGETTGRYTGGTDPWKGLDAFTSHGNGMPLNWHNQGSDAGLYSNDDIHAVRILVMEPTTDRHRGHRAGRLFFNHGNERLRILGEIPVRKFSEGGTQSRDPDGNPDTSFLAKIPADTAFTFQTLDARGMVLNMAQTWHQLRPGEMRTDCGGCHAHSQKPTMFSKTEAGRRPESLWDLTENTPLVTERSRDESGRRWDEAAATGLRFAAGEALDVEYFHDIRPILDRSCVACHTRERDDPPAGLVLDADVDRERKDHLGEFPGTYYRLALDEEARYGHKPFGYDSWGYPNASRYVRKYQSRRSLLVWKIFGERLDGFLNSDHPSESEPGSGKLWWKGEPADGERYRAAWDLDFTGDEMPPAKAVAEGKVQPLSDEDRRTVVRWIDLGCPVDLSAGDPAQGRAQGWFGDDNRPVLTLQQPARGEKRIQRIVIGMHDYYSGIDRASFSVVANFPLEGAAAGENVAAQFRESAEGVWTWDLKEPAAVPSGAGETGVLTVSVRDVQGNETRVVRRWH